MITTEGTWQCDLFGEVCWNINYSSILTQLIQDAGRWCKFYASDLFIMWNCSIEKHMKDPTWEGGVYKFGFRESGVDNDFQISRNLENVHYYREIRTLTVTIEGLKIRMELT